MAVKKGQIIDVVIEKSAFGALGLVHVDGLAVFVEKAVPGDRVQAQIVRKKKSWARARLLEIMEPSVDRVEAPCPYSGNCGGCKWQFLKYPKQLEYKTQHVNDAMQHIAGLEDVVVHPAIGSERIFGYRNKMEFSFSDYRWLTAEEMEAGVEVDRSFALGLHVPGTFNKVMDISACLLQTDGANEILASGRKYARESGFPTYGLKSHEGFWRFFMLRHSQAKDQYLVNLITAQDRSGELAGWAENLMEKLPSVVSVVNNVTARKAGIAVGEFEVPLAGKTTITDKIGPYEFSVSANSFFQTNTLGAEKLYNVVSQYADLSGNETVLDLYSGTGTIPIWLSASAKTVTGIEIVESAIQDAWKNCERNNVTNCRFVAGDILKTLPDVETSPNVVIIDPPRSGMHPKVVKQVLDINAPKVVYVSCNPSTLARDLSMMQENYKVLEVQPVDMFPHTHHIEAVARLVRK